MVNNRDMDADKKERIRQLLDNPVSSKWMSLCLMESYRCLGLSDEEERYAFDLECKIRSVQNHLHKLRYWRDHRHELMKLGIYFDPFL
jgi:hypothetical protein